MKLFANSLVCGNQAWFIIRDLFQKIDAARANGYARQNIMASVLSDGNLSDASVYSDASGLEVNGMAEVRENAVVARIFDYWRSGDRRGFAA